MKGMQCAKYPNSIVCLIICAQYVFATDLLSTSPSIWPGAAVHNYASLSKPVTVHSPGPFDGRAISAKGSSDGDVSFNELMDELSTENTAAREPTNRRRVRRVPRSAEQPTQTVTPYVDWRLLNPLRQLSSIGAKHDSLVLTVDNEVLHLGQYPLGLTVISPPDAGILGTDFVKVVFIDAAGIQSTSWFRANGINKERFARTLEDTLKKYSSVFPGFSTAATGLLVSTRQTYLGLESENSIFPDTSDDPTIEIMFKPSYHVVERCRSRGWHLAWVRVEQRLCGKYKVILTEPITKIAPRGLVSVTLYESNEVANG